MSRIRADQLVNRAGSGGPKFPNGVADGFSVSGVITATSYRGDGSQLTGIDASSLKDGSDVKVQAVSGGANVTGNVAATGNVSAVDGTFSGNATVQGNLTVNGTTTTIDTAVTAVDSLAVDGSVGIGTDNPSGTLDISAAASTDMLMFKNGATNFARIGYNSANGTAILDVRSEGHTRFLTSGNNERLRITSDGKVGINTTIEGKSAADNLTIADAANCGVTIRSGTTNFGSIYFSDATTGAAEYDGYIQYSQNTQYLSFGVAQVERLHITSGGDILPGADNTQDLGSSAKRFANIYTGDLNLSNEGSTNDVDGTWGNYTIQEGEDDLFLINRRTGKKYKFNLTEVN